jgi:hypothetical protein
LTGSLSGALVAGGVSAISQSVGLSRVDVRTDLLRFLELDPS